MNAQGVAVERRLGRPILNGFHGLWCVGLGAGAGVAALAAGAHVRPLVQFAVVGGVIAAISTAALSGLLQDRASPPGAAAGHAHDAARDRSSRAALVLGAIAFAAFCAEGSAMDWSAVYLREDVGAGSAVAATGLFAFSVSMALSRFAADRLAARIGSARLMRRSTLIAAAGLGIGLAVNRSPAAIAGFALFGAGLAPVVSTAFSAAGRLGGPSSSRLLGRVVTAGYIGSVLGPLIIGGVSQFASVRVALAVPVSLALAISLGSHAASGAREPSSAVHPIPAER